MKITIAYISEEQEEAATILAALRPLLAWEKIRKSKVTPPFNHIYLTKRKPEAPRRSTKNA
mgnify:CR=1 FL=1